MQKVWGQAKYGIQFDSEACEWIGINDLDLARWRATYPDMNVDHEIRKAAQWLIDNVEQLFKKKDMRRYLGGWLAKEDSNGHGQAAQTGQRRQREAGRHRQTREDRQYR